MEVSKVGTLGERGEAKFVGFKSHKEGFG